MPKRRNEATAAELLSTWTDSDTAMQIVGTNLGIFGAGFLDPEIVLASETPLRNALFDVLLSLAEGGAVDVRPTGDGYYAFRWRKDYALGALSSDRVTTIDIDAPSPYLLELADARRERDQAVARAEAAEALAAEREDALRRIGAQVLQSGASAPLFDQDDPADTAAGDPPDEIEFGDDTDVVDLAAAEAAEAGDVVYMTPPPRKRPTRKELDERLAHALAPDYEAEPDAEDDDESDESRSHNSKWSAYALDTPGGPLAPVERVAHEG